MRFFNNFFTILKGPSFSCGLVCLAAHLNSHESNRNRIVFFRLGGFKRPLHTPSVSSAFWSSCLGLCSAGSWKPPRVEGAQCWATIAVLDWCHSDLFFPLKSECPHVSVTSHPAAVQLSRECCCILLIISGTGRKFLGSLSSLLTEYSSLSLSSQGMCSHPHTNLTALSCAHCNLSTSFS